MQAGRLRDDPDIFLIQLPDLRQLLHQPLIRIDQLAIILDMPDDVLQDLGFQILISLRDRIGSLLLLGPFDYHVSSPPRKPMGFFFF